MDLFYVLAQIASITLFFTGYLIFFGGKSKKRSSHYANPGWNFMLKFVSAQFAVKSWQRKRPPLEGSLADELPRADLRSGESDALTVRAAAPDGTRVLLALRHCGARPRLTEVTVRVQLPEGALYLLPRHPDTVIGAPCEDEPWSAAGLKFEVLEPFVRMRILYNGLLVRQDTGQTMHVRINLMWTAASQPVRHPEEWGVKLAAHALALEQWRHPYWVEMLDKWGDGGWAQWGSVRGQLMAGAAPPVTLLARGLRERAWAPASLRPVRRCVSLLATAHDGTSVHLRAVSYKNSLSHAVSGSIRFPNCDVETITSSDFSLEDFCEQKNETPSTHVIHVGAGNRQVKLVLDLPTDRLASCKLFSGSPYELETMCVPVQALANGSLGAGLLELGYTVTGCKEPALSLLPERQLRWSEAEPAGYCVPFSVSAAACPQLVGAKGASLALLSSVQNEEGYRVPPGYCLTTLALEQHLAAHSDLVQAVRDLESANADYDQHIFKEKCTKAVELFNNTPIEETVKHEITSHLEELRSKVKEENLLKDVSFAVRSSAIGEDSEALSAAGQNETVLGCRTDDDVLRAVQRCWGSLFAFNSAHYRRVHGQPCLCGAGVVVQAMVPARAAGVLFTRYPDCGDPSRILITANYGLGESVVSGSVEPDTIVVSRSPGNELQVASTTLGSKLSRVALGTGSTGGTELLEVAAESRAQACLTSDESLQLARLALRQEELWAAPRDIEWAIYEEQIYLLQARPITSLERWSAEELLHELDSPRMSDEDLYSFANTGEVLPGALSPLTVGTVVPALAAATYRITYGRPPPRYPYAAPYFISHFRCGLDMYNCVFKRMAPSIDVGTRMMDMAVHGHPVADEHTHAIAVHRNPPTLSARLYTILIMIRTIFKTKSYLEDSVQTVKKLKIDLSKSESPIGLLEEFESAQSQLHRLAFNHVCNSGGSMFGQVVTMSILSEGGDEMTTEHCMDMGAMLTTCSDLVSGEVPAGMATLARALADSGRFEQFRAQPPESCLRWLRENIPEVHVKVSQFLEKHAHRSIKEFDLATETWGLAPQGLLASLQAARAPVEQRAPPSLSDAAVVTSLRSPKKSLTRKMLRLMLPLCRRGVAHREGTKAQLILAVHKLRLAARRLGRLMARAWLLPSPDLVFYFTPAELRRFIQERDPVLLNKASQRRQQLPAWDALQFPEMSEGRVEPLERARRQAGSGAALRGAPVCAGEVLGRACVVATIDEITQLQQGDILITHSTDIGWSPYFPLLGGVVTELGGLISHGAVIAREYGLPCVVGAAGATSFCNTGDMVFLSGSTGVLEKVDPTPPTTSDTAVLV